MNPEHIGNGFLSGISGSLTLLVGGWMESVLGPVADKTIFGRFTWGDLGVMVCFALMVLFLNGVAAAVVHHQSKKTPVQPGTAPIKRHVFGALGKPVYLLIWICGLYFVATPLLLKLQPDEGLIALRIFFDRIFDLGTFAALVWLFFRFTHVLEARLAYWAGKTNSKLDDLFVPLLGKSLRVFVPVMGLIFGLPLLHLPGEYAGVLSKGGSILLVVAVAVILSQAVGVGEKAMMARFDIKLADNLQARKIYTQVHVLSKTLYFVIALFTVASVLMMFEEVRRLGTSILASAGVVGVILGFAAQKTIANLFAGFQLAMTQPIRLDDVVVLEGEWGRIEEITLTYVSVHLWDDRRLVVPLSYFIEKPFQNWTRSSSQLLGAVLLYVDYSLPVEDIRKALKGIVEGNPLWDKRFWNLQVTDATEYSMQIRVLATASDSSIAFNLRCDIREKLIAFIQKNHPHSLPLRRNQTQNLVTPAKP